MPCILHARAIKGSIYAGLGQILHMQFAVYMVKHKKGHWELVIWILQYLRGMGDGIIHEDVIPFNIWKVIGLGICHRFGREEIVA